MTALDPRASKLSTQFPAIKAADSDLSRFPANWYAIFTVPQNERSVVRHLDMREVESFYPTFETERVWQNRQRVKIISPLFPTYVFARIRRQQRSAVLNSPGVLRIVGNRSGPIPIPSADIEFLRTNLCRRRFTPYNELAIGERVRIRRGTMEGVEGTLIRKKSGLRFVLTLELINQHAAVEVDADELEPISNQN
jgi:transcription antitermination factor NusG